MTMVDATHDARLRSWVASARQSGCDFPIQNLPFGRFRRKDSVDAWHIGVAIGDQVLDLAASGLIDTDDMNAVMACEPGERRTLRNAISEGLREGSGKEKSWTKALIPQTGVELT